MKGTVVQENAVIFSLSSSVFLDKVRNPSITPLEMKQQLSRKPCGNLKTFKFEQNILRKVIFSNSRVIRNILRHVVSSSKPRTYFLISVIRGDNDEDFPSVQKIGGRSSNVISLICIKYIKI